MLLMGVTLYSCQSKYLELRIRKTKVGGWPSRILSGLPNGLLVWSWARTTTWPGIPTNGADRARGREHSLTLIRPSISSAAALIGPLILLARLSLLLQSLLSTLVVTPYSLCEGCVVFSFFFLNRYEAIACLNRVSTPVFVGWKRYREEKDRHPELLGALFSA